MAQSLTVPYLSRFEGVKIQPGQTVKIQGSETGDSFEVDFMAGSDILRSDMPFIISVFKKDKKVFLNDRRAGNLGKEVVKKYPFQKGDAIDLRIRIQSDKFQVYANQKHLCDFEYRQPLISATHLYISGSIDLKNVTWGGKHYPVPYQAQIEGNLEVGKKLIVTGLPDKKPVRISINLMNSQNDILFHIQFRFDEKNVVMNSKFEGKFGAEEIVTKNPLKVDSLFDVTIVAELRTFQVFVDNDHIYSYAYRGDPNTVDRLSIDGDVELLGVYVK